MQCSTHAILLEIIFSRLLKAIRSHFMRYNESLNILRRIWKNLEGETFDVEHLKRCPALIIHLVMIICRLLNAIHGNFTRYNPYSNTLKQELGRISKDNVPPLGVIFWMLPFYLLYLKSKKDKESWSVVLISLVALRENSTKSLLPLMSLNSCPKSCWSWLFKL